MPPTSYCFHIIVSFPISHSAALKDAEVAWTILSGKVHYAEVAEYIETTNKQQATRLMYLLKPY